MITKYKWKTHDEWLNLRKAYIGGSDAGSIIGMNPYKSAYTLWAEKTGRALPFEGNITTEVGAYLEEFVAKKFEHETGKKVRRENFMLVNDKYPWAEANVDRMVVGEKALLEIKTTNSFPNMKKIKGGEFPDAWYAQMTHYLAVTELERAYLAVLVNCREIHFFTLERDEEEIQALMEQEKRFKHYIDTDAEPPVDGSDSTTDTIAEMYPDDNGTTVSLIGYENDLRQYLDITQNIRDLEALKKEKINKIKAFMGAAENGESDNFKCTWKTGNRNSFDVKAFTQDHPDIDLSGYYKTSQYRTFKINERK